MGKNAKKPRMAAAPVPMPAAPVHVVPASEALSAIANLAATVKGCKKSDSLFAKIAAKKQVPTSELHTAATKVAARNEKAKIKRDTDDFLRTEDQRKALKTDKNKKAKVRRDTADFHRTEDQRVAFKTDKKKKAQIKLDTADFLRTEDQRVAFQENKALREKEWREYNDRLRTEDQRVAFKADTKAKRAAYLAKKKLERLGEEGGEA
mmetsp:Transcript_46576/g.74462  ORF Transcript_46576/g.74462 Transcript_46576/m.74462 type:complete len:207 (+) Transcript_46576:117-737(+)